MPQRTGFEMLGREHGLAIYSDGQRYSSPNDKLCSALLDPYFCIKMATLDMRTLAEKDSVIQANWCDSGVRGLGRPLFWLALWPQGTAKKAQVR